MEMQPPTIAKVKSENHALQRNCAFFICVALRHALQPKHICANSKSRYLCAAKGWGQVAILKTSEASHRQKLGQSQTMVNLLFF